MPIPSGVETVTVTSGEPLTLPDGTLYRGHIRFIAPDLAVLPSDDYTMGGEAVAELVNGEFSITLVPQDATGISPTGWSYTIVGEFVNAPGWTRYSVLSKDEPSVILSDILDSTSTEPALSSASVFRNEAVKLMGLDTGILWGADLNDSATVGSVGLTAGSGVIVDYLDDDASPTITLVPISTQTIAISDLVSPVTWLMMSAAGTIVQQTTRPTNAQRRTHLQLGAVVIASGDVIVEQTLPQILPQPLNQVYDLMDAIGPFNITGNKLSPAGSNLQLAKEVGTVFSRSFNHFANDEITNDPHVSNVAAQNPVQMRYVTQTPSAPVATVTSVSPGFYDNGGVVTAIPGAGTVATIQRVFLFPENDVANQVVVQYGQTIYSSLDAAVAAINTTPYVKNPINESGVLIGYVVVTKNAANLSNANSARIIAAARFSENPAGVSTALSLSVPLSGGTMTGPLILSQDPVEDLGAATKQYIDNSLGGIQTSKPWVFDVSDDAYGAVGDARVLIDGAITSGTAILTSASNGFANAAPGMYVSVKGAGPTGVTTLIAQIASKQSDGQITLNTNASVTVANAIVWFGTDDTAAIQAAIDAAEAYLAAGNLYAQVYLPPLAYIIAGPLNNTKFGNGQLVFGPYSMTANKKTLEFASDNNGAAGVRTWLQTVPQHSGACLVSFGVYSSTSAQITNINADGNPGVISGPNEGFGYGVAANFSNMIPVLRNISFLTVHSSFGLTYGAANFWGCANAMIQNFSTSTAGVVPGTDYTSPGTFGTGLSVGLLLPAPGNNDLVYCENISIGGGYTYAMFFTEHGLIDRYMALYCWAGLVVGGTYAGSVGSVHAMKILSASIEACTNEVYILGPGSAGVGPIIDIDQLSTESGNPNIAGQAAHMAAARGVIRWTGLFTEANLVHDNPTGIESINAQAISPVREVTTGTHTVRPIDRMIKCNAAGGAITLNLPSAAPNPVVYTFIKTDVTGNTATIDPDGSQTINGQATAVLDAQWESITVRSDGTNWIAY